MLSTASPTVSVPPRATVEAEELDEAVEPDEADGELDVVAELHPARTMAKAAADRQAVRFLFMTRSFGMWS
jgi:hypothetical protein